MFSTINFTNSYWRGLGLLSCRIFLRRYKVPKDMKKLVDVSKVPKINFDQDVKESIAKGSGPGGQKVNTSSNCVVLVHEETRVFVKCHESRSLEKNRQIARMKLVDKLDLFLNKEDSVQSQVERIEAERKAERKERARLRLEEKARQKELDKQQDVDTIADNPDLKLADCEPESKPEDPENEKR